jgi:hypothetical protein
LVSLILAACGGGSTTLIGGTVQPGYYLISGTIAGLPAGQRVILLNNGADPTTVSALGVFTFATPVARNGTYSVTVQTQPGGEEVCTVSGGSGAGVTANVASVTVTCALNSLSIGGTISGLAAGQVVTLQNNGADPTPFNANGAFQFGALVAQGSGYSVTVAAQPVGQTCSVTGGVGAGVMVSVASIAVNCSTNTFAIGGSVSGLATGTQVTLFNNGADALTVTANSTFTFATPVAYDGSYSVTVSTQPTGQTCTVSGATGSGVTAAVASVTVTCSTNTFPVGGTVSGLAAGGQVTLFNNGADALTQTADGAFTFATPVAYDGSYAVTVSTQPIGQTCTVSGGAGSGVTAAVASVTVTCSTNTFSIGGTLSGLASGQQVTLFNNGADALTVTANGAFTFATPVAYNGSYSITVSTQPTGQTCTVSGGAGSGVTADVASVSVTCSTNTFSVGGTVSGLGTGDQVTLYDNGADALTVTTDGSFTFATPVAYDGSYSVTVSTQPTGQTCTVSGGEGSGVTAAVASVTVTCSTNTFSIGGSVSGLAASQQVTLLNNGADATTVTANGSFTFATPVTYNGSYSVTVSTQPTGQTCTVSGGTGSGVTAGVASIAVTCSTNTFPVGGTISGLASGAQVTLLNNGADATTVTANGGFTFSTPVTYDGSYSVTVSTQPTGQTCTVSGGAGAGVTAAVASVSVTCAANTYTVGGTASGLASGQQVTLFNNGADALTVTADGSFTFATSVAYNGSYSVTVSTQPTGQTCTVSGASGSGVTADVASVSVTCSTDTFSVGGTVSGLGSGDQVTLYDNGADALTVTANGSFTFMTQVAYNGSYSVTVSTQPTGQTCTVANGSGNNVMAATTSVTVTCTSTAVYSVSGTISGLSMASGQQIVLSIDGTATTFTTDGSHTFLTGLSSGTSYTITIETQPTIVFCELSNGTGTVVANVTNVTVSCYPP